MWTYIIAAALFVAALAGAAGAGYMKGVQHESDRHAEYRAEVEGAMAAVAERARLLAEQNERNAREIKAQYAVAASSLAAGYNSRLDGLRGQLDSCQGRLPSADSATARADATSTGDLSAAAGPASASFENVCRETERDAAACALTLVWLQEYVSGMR